jgi:hypothetical protein
MRVLVACERSGCVRDAFLALGHDAWSCDLMPSETSGPHFQGDVFAVLDCGWDLMISHPPCTYLSASGMHWTTRGLWPYEKTLEALKFVRRLWTESGHIPFVCVENPVGILSTRWRPPDQIIQPWQFGEDASKRTCLWLKGLPLLRPTKVVAPKGWMHVNGLEPVPKNPQSRILMVKRDRMLFASEIGPGQEAPPLCWSNQTKSGQNKLGPSSERSYLRAKTYPGVARAMAEQWGPYIVNFLEKKQQQQQQKT